MTASSSCKVILYRDCCRNKKISSCRSVNSAGHDSLKPKTASRKPFSSYRMRTGKGFEDQLFTLEKIARCQFAKISAALTYKKFPKWLDQMLAHSILPTLHRIGFDAPISKVVFHIASSSWKLMGPQNEKIIAFHPIINRQIEEVRQGLALKTCQTSSLLPFFMAAPPLTIPGTIKDIVSPENLFDLLDEISTSWITLPRAFRFLQEHQCRYLPVYLKTIERETRELGLEVFSRIAVEFVGNFSLKFADWHHPPGQVAKLLFYGYAALFLKTLRCPPENLANSAAFDNFFKWICRLVRKSDFLGDEECAFLKQLIKMRSITFPARNFSSPQTHCEIDISRIMVSLRHGCIGISTILKYFGVDQFLETRQSGLRFGSRSIQNEVRELLYTIQIKYQKESKQTREYIKLFIGRLRSAYALVQPDFPDVELNLLDRIFNHLQAIMNS